MSTLGAENLELSQYNNLNHVTFVDLTYFPDISSRILMKMSSFNDFNSI